MKLVLAGVVFDDNLSNETIFPDIKVNIRFPGEIRSAFSTTASSPANWLTNLLFPTYQTNAPRGDTSDVGGGVPGYFPEGFLALQHALSSSLTEVLADTETIPEVLLQRFPYPPYLYDSLLVALQNMVSFIILLSLTYTSISIVKTITSEKELQLKETMKIMGLPNWLHWTAWFVNNFLMLLISVALMVVMLKVPWYSGTDVTVFTHSNWLLVFIFLMMYAVAMICFCFMITSFFSKANSASTVAGLAWFVLFAPYLFIQNNYTELSLSTKLVTSLFSNTAMGYGFQLILMHEGTELAQARDRVDWIELAQDRDMVDWIELAQDRDMVDWIELAQDRHMVDWIQLAQDRDMVDWIQLAQDRHMVDWIQLAQDRHMVDWIQLAQDRHMVDWIELAQDRHMVDWIQLTQDRHMVDWIQLAQDRHMVDWIQLAQDRHMVNWIQLAQDRHMLKIEIGDYVSKYGNELSSYYCHRVSDVPPPFPSGKGIQWDNVWEPATQDDDLYFGHLIIFMLLDAAIYLLIAIYVEAVFPGAYGVPKRWYFPLQVRYATRS
uniref:(California timema) hypothetical protein n=1 Tax=Timema californicum TaxID=61474 RepID=A0A7R9JHS9_TIMCA|nr:unnamed protein product [Timema californicum]